MFILAVCLMTSKMNFRAKVATVDGLSGFLYEGATVGVAWDGSDHKLLVSVDGSAFTDIPFPDPVRPNTAVGAALFPIFSGRGGCKIKHNMGGKQYRFLHDLPSPDYISCAEAQTQQVELAIIQTRGLSDPHVC
jgi:hypothetical protein